MSDYIHGYAEREAARLSDQAETLAELLHHDTAFPRGSRVLEAGCGTGAQTIYLARSSPLAAITSIDLSEDSLREARARTQRLGITNVQFQQADVYEPPFAPASFDHVFICFVLEHLREPLLALRKLKRLLKAGGTLTAIEGDHGSAFFHPRSDAAQHAIRCQVDLQAAAGGNALIGRELYPLLTQAGFTRVRVSPRMVYVDAGKPRLVEGFIKNTFTAMIEGIREKALKANLIEETVFDAGIRDLYRTAQPDGVFCYTFFKAVARL